MNIDPWDIEHDWPWPEPVMRSYNEEESAAIAARASLLLEQSRQTARTIAAAPVPFQAGSLDAARLRGDVTMACRTASSRS